GRSPVEQFIFFDEATRAGAPVPLVTLNTVGPTLMTYGTEEQKERFLPPILRGEMHFAIGYTEPGAGTDLASLRTRAVRDGDEYEGWKLITTQLNHERVALAPPGRIEQRAEEVRRWARETRLPDGRRVIDQQWVQLVFARVHARLEALRLMSLQVASELEHEALNPADASSVKVYGSEASVEIYDLLMQVTGLHGALQRGSPGAAAPELEKAYRHAVVLTFGGGVNEVQREIIAMAGLGMPRPLR